MTRFSKTKPLRKANAYNIKQFFSEYIISRYSLSDIIIIDSGSEFKKELYDYYKDLGIARVIILAHNLQVNRLIKGGYFLLAGSIVK